MAKKLSKEYNKIKIQRLLVFSTVIVTWSGHCQLLIKRIVSKRKKRVKVICLTQLPRLALKSFSSMLHKLIMP